MGRPDRNRDTARVRILDAGRYDGTRGSVEEHSLGQRTGPGGDLAKYAFACLEADDAGANGRTTPAASRPIAIGNATSTCSLRSPDRTLMSAGFTPAAVISTNSWPCPGTGIGVSMYACTAASPYS